LHKLPQGKVGTDFGDAGDETTAAAKKKGNERTEGRRWAEFDGRATAQSVGKGRARTTTTNERTEAEMENDRNRA
jgi:hypothetical protein